jgi:hypothetical protein
VSERGEPPLWLQAVQRFERAIGEPVEQFVRSDAYFDWLAQANKARARFQELADPILRDWLRLWNVPAASDVRALREQLGRVERRLEEVAKELEDRAEAEAGPKPAARRDASKRRADGTRPRRTPTKPAE